MFGDTGFGAYEYTADGYTRVGQWIGEPRSQALVLLAGPLADALISIAFYAGGVISRNRRPTASLVLTSAGLTYFLATVHHVWRLLVGNAGDLPLFLFNEHGDCLVATLRPGNVHGADDWDDLLVPELERQQAEGKRVAFRADAAFAKPEIYDTLEQRDVDYAIRMPANKSLEVEIEDILFRPPGRPSRKPLVRYKSFRYQAKSWDHVYRLRVLGQWFDGIRFYAAASSPRRSRRTWAGLR